MGACMNSKEGKKNPVAAFFGAIGKFFKEFGEAAAKGDGAVKASLLVAGAGYWKRKQIRVWSAFSCRNASTCTLRRLWPS